MRLEGLNSDIYVMDADGKNPVNLTRNPTGNFDPSWSPDETKIVFASNRDGNYEIYVMNADGSHIVRLTTHPAADSSPVWFGAPLAVSPKRKLATQWGKIKQKGSTND